MCRFAYYLGPPLKLSKLITEPRNSLIHQSYASEERVEPLNGDGFGLSWRSEGEADWALFKSLTPAWNNANLKHLARSLHSKCILAHVRAASSGLSVNEANCHPFTRGPYAFMHNGEIGGFRQVRRALLRKLSDEAFDQMEGSTDSELFLGLLMDELGPQDGSASVESMATALKRTMDCVHEVVSILAPESPCYFNMILSTEDRAVASRVAIDDAEPPSLYLNHGQAYTCENGICTMLQPDCSEVSTLVCSEPLSSEPSWHQVPANHFVLLERGSEARVEDWEHFS